MSDESRKFQYKRVKGLAAMLGEPAPKRQQWVMTIMVDPDAPEDEADAFMDAVAEAAMAYEPRTAWDAFIMASYE